MSISKRQQIKKMMQTFWFKQASGGVVFAVMTLLFILLAHWLHGDVNDNPNPNPVAYLGASGVMQVVLRPNDVNQYVTGGRINGEPVEFLIDTGSVDVALPYALAQRLKLQLTPGGISMTGNGDVPTWSAWLDQVEVGGLIASRIKATILPNMQSERVLLGMSYLKYMELLLANGQLTLRPANVQ